MTSDEQAAHDLFYELKPECQAHADGCKGCAEAIQMIAALLASRALEEAKLMHPEPCDFRGFKENCLKCQRIAALEQAAAGKAGLK